jgi:hypothetical protein
MGLGDVGLVGRGLIMFVGLVGRGLIMFVGLGGVGGDGLGFFKATLTLDPENDDDDGFWPPYSCNRAWYKLSVLS